jgi:flagellar biogenesis protein FliO
MELISQLLAAVAVLALLGLVLWTLRRAGAAHFPVPPGRGGKRRRLEVVESRPLGSGHALHLVRLGDRAVVIAVHPAGSSVIDRGPWPEMAGGGEGGQR